MDYSQDGDLSKYDAADIEDACEWDGEPGKLYSALRDSKFVDHDNVIHDWYDYAGRLVEKREQNKERKRRSRAKKVEVQTGHADVTRDDNVTDSSVTGLPNPTQPNPTEPNHTEQNTTNNTVPPDSNTVVVEMNPYRMFENEGFGTISPVIAEQLSDLVETFGERWVCEALKRSVVAGKRKISYVVGILKNWKSEGVDEPWTKEPPKRVIPRGNQKPEIPIAVDSDPPEDVSDEEFHRMIQEAKKMQEGKGGRSYEKALA